ncbi:MAG: response regulator [Magnetococcales bacterium]|nr:response regulator [Magnetococcales bacterium]
MSENLPKILIVDDLPANLRAMHSLLSKMDAEIHEADSGAQTLLLCSENDYALLLLDVNMPNMNGFEVANILRGVEKTRDLPIIFVTAAASDEYQTLKGFEMGAVDFILKPIDDRILRSKVNVFVDLYNKKRELQEKNSELQNIQSILLLMMDALFFVSTQGVITKINQETLFGYSSSELLDSQVDKLFDSDAFGDDSILNLLVEGAVNNTDAKLKAKDGSMVPVLLSGSPRHDAQGDISSFVLVAKDITDYKQAQKALRDKEAQLVHSSRLTAMGEMATGIAHELNQPLTVIRIRSQSLGHAVNNGTTIEADIVSKVSSEITQQIDRATTIINHMSAFARVEINDPVKAIDPAIPANQALLFFKEQFRIREIELELKIGTNLPLVRMHGNRFEQILVNLLSNGRYAVDKKAESDEDYQKQITLSLSEGAERKNVILEVKDNGIGMSETELQRCLEPFFTTKEEGKGTGLGLHIVRGIVEELKGEITVESEKGVSTVAKVILPAATDIEGDG